MAPAVEAPGKEDESQLARSGPDSSDRPGGCQGGMPICILKRTTAVRPAGESAGRTAGYAICAGGAWRPTTGGSHETL
jgi:hypothetical protein